MAVLQIVAQHEQKPCAHALPRVILKAHALGNGVRHAEILISGIPAQHVRIVGDDLDRIRPVLAEQRDSGGGRQVISRQISDGLPHAEDTLEFVGSRQSLFRRDALDLRQRHGIAGDDLQRIRAENIHDTPCQCFADVRQRAAGKVAPDCRCAFRHAHLTRLHAELFAEAGVCDKAAVQRHVFSHIHIRKLAHRGVKVSPAGKFQHRVAVFLVAVYDIFNCARKGLPFLFLRHARLPFILSPVEKAGLLRHAACGQRFRPCSPYKTARGGIRRVACTLLRKCIRLFGCRLFPGYFFFLFVFFDAPRSSLLHAGAARCVIPAP